MVKIKFSVWPQPITLHSAKQRRIVSWMWWTRTMIYLEIFAYWRLDLSQEAGWKKKSPLFPHLVNLSSFNHLTLHLDQWSIEWESGMYEWIHSHTFNWDRRVQDLDGRTSNILSPKARQASIFLAFGKPSRPDSANFFGEVIQFWRWLMSWRGSVCLLTLKSSFLTLF